MREANVGAKHSEDITEKMGEHRIPNRFQTGQMSKKLPDIRPKERYRSIGTYVVDIIECRGQSRISRQCGNENITILSDANQMAVHKKCEIHILYCTPCPSSKSVTKTMNSQFC